MGYPAAGSRCPKWLEQARSRTVANNLMASLNSWRPSLERFSSNLTRFSSVFNSYLPQLLVQTTTVVRELHGHAAVHPVETDHIQQGGPVSRDQQLNMPAISVVKSFGSTVNSAGMALLSYWQSCGDRINDADEALRRVCSCQRQILPSNSNNSWLAMLQLYQLIWNDGVKEQHARRQVVQQIADNGYLDDLTVVEQFLVHEQRRLVQ